MILSVNIDHIATIRNARSSLYPDILRACKIIKDAGGEIITVHLREDRRHIKDGDVKAICQSNILPVNLEIAPTEEMVEIAIQNKPQFVCFVPEKREELTTEGGLNISPISEKLKNFVYRLNTYNIKTSLFIEPNYEAIEEAIKCNPNTIELHTGKFAESFYSQSKLPNQSFKESNEEFKKIAQAAQYAKEKGLEVHAGHGLTFESATEISKIKNISILHIGHFLITESIFIGLEDTVKKMLNAIS